jgi:3-polyprenyl-4-hydroxybenzoate decarboxylase
MMWFKHSRSMSEIATGVTTTLLTQAADVTLKERRRLVPMVRETPLHTGHLRTMAIADRAYVMEIGRIIHNGPARKLIDDPEVRRAYLGL